MSPLDIDEAFSTELSSEPCLRIFYRSRYVAIDLSLNTRGPSSTQCCLSVATIYDEHYPKAV